MYIQDLSMVTATLNTLRSFSLSLFQKSQTVWWYAIWTGPMSWGMYFAHFFDKDKSLVRIWCTVVAFRLVSNIILGMVMCLSWVTKSSTFQMFLCECPLLVFACLWRSTMQVHPLLNWSIQWYILDLHRIQVPKHCQSAALTCRYSHPSLTANQMQTL